MTRWAVLGLAACHRVDDPDQPVSEDLDGDGVLAPFDCDDDDPAVHPGADEPCDGIDRDCDGVPKEPTDWFADEDGDGFGAPGTRLGACEPPDGRVANNQDCDDTTAAIAPTAIDRPNDGVDQDCAGGDASELDCEAPVVHDGSFTAVDDPSIEAFCSGYTAIDGDLVLSGTTATELAVLDCLCEVTGDVVITGNAALTAIDAELSVGGDLVISDNPVLSSITWSSGADLERVVIERDALLVSVELDLDNVEEGVHLADLPVAALTEIDVLDLTGGIQAHGVAGTLDVWVHFDALGDVVVTDNPDLLELDLGLETVGSVVVEDNPELDRVSFPKLEAIGGDLIVARNASLEDSGFEDLFVWSFAGCTDQVTAIPGSLILEDNPLVGYPVDFELDPGCLETVGGDLVVRGNSELASVQFLDLVTAIGGDFTLADNAAALNHGVRDELMPDLVSVGGDLTLANVDTNGDVLELLQTVGGDFTLTGVVFGSGAQDFNTLSAIGGDMLLTASGYRIYSSYGAGDTISIETLVSVGGDVVATLSGGFRAISLASVGGDVSYTATYVGPYGSVDLRMPEVPGSLSLTGAALLGSRVDVASVLGDVRITGGWAGGIPIDEPWGLTTVGGELEILHSNDLEDLDLLANLESVGGALTVSVNPSLTSLAGLAALESVGDDLSVQYNDRLVTVGAPSLTTVVGEAWITDNPLLTDVDLPAWQSAGSSFYLTDNVALPTVDGLSAMTEVGGSLWVCGNDALVDLAGLHGLEAVYSLYVIDNASLDLDEAWALHDAIGAENIPGTVTIQTGSFCP